MNLEAPPPRGRCPGVTAPQTPSIVYLVAAHDAEPWLGAALDSLRAQSRPDWACVVVDDASFDETHAIARAAADTDPRIRAVTIPHAGVAGARDAGLDHAPPGAPFVCFLDADDTVEPDHADALVGALGPGRTPTPSPAATGSSTPGATTSASPSCPTRATGRSTARSSATASSPAPASSAARRSTPCAPRGASPSTPASPARTGSSGSP